MPKTRRAGRKNQLRRLIRQRYHAVPVNHVDNSQLNNYPDEKYEVLSSKKASFNCETRVKSFDLISVDVEDKQCRPVDIPEKDPQSEKSPTKSS